MEVQCLVHWIALAAEAQRRYAQAVLENAMQLKYTIHSAMMTNEQNAMAELQARTPVFTTLTNATVPVKPAGPKRMIFVAVMLFLATIGTVMYLYRKELKDWF